MFQSSEILIDFPQVLSNNVINRQLSRGDVSSVTPLKSYSTEEVEEEILFNFRTRCNIYLAFYLLDIKRKYINIFIRANNRQDTVSQ
jgi:hypothetical protein